MKKNSNCGDVPLLAVRACGIRLLVTGLLTVVILQLSLSHLAAMNRWSALSMIESGNNDRAIGAASEVSRYQIKPALWSRFAPDESNPLNQSTALAVARGIMHIRCDMFERRYHRPPTDFEFYVLWNAPVQLLAPRAHATVTKTVTARARRFCNLIVADNMVSDRPPDKTLTAAGEVVGK